VLHAPSSHRPWFNHASDKSANFEAPFAVLLSYFVLFTVSFSLGVDIEQCNIEYKVQRLGRKRLPFVQKCVTGMLKLTRNVRVNRDFVAASQNKLSRWKL